jgi:hypothetical protein
MSLFIPFPNPHHLGTTGKPKTDNRQTLGQRTHSSPSLSPKAGSRSASLDRDLFALSKQRPDSMERIDVITHALEEEGGESSYRDIAAQLEEIFNREAETKSPELSSKAMDEEGGFTASRREHANLLSDPNINMGLINATLENKGKSGLFKKKQH